MNAQADSRSKKPGKSTLDINSLDVILFRTLLGVKSGNPVGMPSKTRTKAKAPAGGLIKKTHLQVVLSFMTPPSMGPSKYAIAKVNEVMLPYRANLFAGTISGTTTKPKDMVPEPPMPWKARNMMSCVIVWADPHAPEAITKIMMDVTKHVFRPTISLTLAHAIRKPV